MSSQSKKATPKKSPARRTPPPRVPSGPRRSVNGAYVGLIVGALVVLIAVIAVVVTRSGDGGDASAGPQTYPVKVTGTALEKQPDAPAADPSIGAVAPTLTGQSLFDGSPLTITPGGGGTPTVVVFLAHWCPHCQREVPILVEWMGSGQKPANLDVVAVSTANNLSDQNSPASSWLRRENWPTPVLADSDDDVASTAYGLSAFPYLVVLGPDGAVKARTSGELSIEDLNTFVQDALK